MRSGDHNQIHAPVQAAVEGEIRLLGIDPVIVRIVQTDNQRVVLLQVLQLHPEGGVTTLMMGKLHTVQKHLAGVRRAQKLQPDLIAGIGFRLAKPAAIVAGAAIVIVAAILSVQVIPCMGKGNRFGSLSVVHFGEQPIVVKGDDFSHIWTPL